MSQPNKKRPRPRIAEAPVNHKHKKKVGKLGFALYFMFWLILLGFFSVAITLQYTDYQALLREEATLVQRIQAEAEQTVELQKDVDFYYSDAFVEKYAREEMGLVRDDEILFVKQ